MSEAASRFPGAYGAPFRFGTEDLVGRSEERRLLAGLLSSGGAGQAQCLVLRGEPGIGKSALIQDLVERADGWQVCQVVGVESEMELSYSGLQQLFGSVSASTAGLPTPHHAAL